MLSCPRNLQPMAAAGRFVPLLPQRRSWPYAMKGAGGYGDGSAKALRDSDATILVIRQQRAAEVAAADAAERPSEPDVGMGAGGKGEASADATRQIVDDQARSAQEQTPSLPLEELRFRFETMQRRRREARFKDLLEALTDPSPSFFVPLACEPGGEFTYED